MTITEFIDLFPGLPLSQAREELEHAASGTQAAEKILAEIETTKPGSYTEVAIP